MTAEPPVPSRLVLMARTKLLALGRPRPTHEMTDLEHGQANDRLRRLQRGRSAPSLSHREPLGIAQFTGVASLRPRPLHSALDVSSDRATFAT